MSYEVYRRACLLHEDVAQPEDSEVEWKRISVKGFFEGIFTNAGKIEQSFDLNKYCEIAGIEDCSSVMDLMTDFLQEHGSVLTKMLEVCGRLDIALENINNYWQPLLLDESERDKPVFQMLFERIAESNSLPDRHKKILPKIILVALVEDLHFRLETDEWYHAHWIVSLIALFDFLEELLSLGIIRSWSEVEEREFYNWKKKDLLIHTVFFIVTAIIAHDFKSGVEKQSGQAKEAIGLAEELTEETMENVDERFFGVEIRHILKYILSFTKHESEFKMINKEVGVIVDRVSFGMLAILLLEEEEKKKKEKSLRKEFPLLTPENIKNILNMETDELDNFISNYERIENTLGSSTNQTKMWQRQLLECARFVRKDFKSELLGIIEKGDVEKFDQILERHPVEKLLENISEIPRLKAKHRFQVLCERMTDPEKQIDLKTLFFIADEKLIYKEKDKKLMDELKKLVDPEEVFGKLSSRIPEIVNSMRGELKGRVSKIMRNYFSWPYCIYQDQMFEDAVLAGIIKERGGGFHYEGKTYNSKETLISFLKIDKDFINKMAVIQSLVLAGIVSSAVDWSQVATPNHMFASGEAFGDYKAVHIAIYTLPIIIAWFCLRTVFEDEKDEDEYIILTRSKFVQLAMRQFELNLGWKRKVF